MTCSSERVPASTNTKIIFVLTDTKNQTRGEYLGPSGEGETDSR